MPPTTEQSTQKTAPPTPTSEKAKPAEASTAVPPPKPSATPSAGFRGLDEDLLAAASKQPAKTAKKKTAQPAAKTETADKPPGTEEGEKPPPTEPSPTGDDDYLMGPVSAMGQVADTTDGSESGEDAQKAATGPLKAPELRAEYARVKKRLAEVEQELTGLKGKGGEVKPVDDSERKAFVDQIATLKKQLEDTTGALKTVAYEQSDEYKTKFEQPFLDAWQEGTQLVSRLTLQDEEGNTRKGTPEDFQRIMSIADDEQAANMAQEMFGPNAFYVLSQRRDIQRIHYQRVKALEEYRSTLSEREKTHAELVKKQNEEREAQRIQNTTLFQKYNQEAAKKYPELFAPIEGDEEGNAILARGYRDADLAFGGAPDLPNDRRVALHSAIRNRAAAFGRLVHQLKTKEAKIAELEKELEEIKGSTPGGGQVSRDEQGEKRLTFEQEIEAAAKRYR